MKYLILFLCWVIGTQAVPRAVLDKHNICTYATATKTNFNDTFDNLNANPLTTHAGNHGQLTPQGFAINYTYFGVASFLDPVAGGQALPPSSPNVIYTAADTVPAGSVAQFSTANSSVVEFDLYSLRFACTGRTELSAVMELQACTVQFNCSDTRGMMSIQEFCFVPDSLTSTRYATANFNRMYGGFTTCRVVVSRSYPLNPSLNVLNLDNINGKAYYCRQVEIEV